MLKKHAPKNINTHLLAFEVSFRQKKPLLCLQAIFKAQSIDPNHWQLHANIIRFLAIGMMLRSSNSQFFRAAAQGILEWRAYEYTLRLSSMHNRLTTQHTPVSYSCSWEDPKRDSSIERTTHPPSRTIVRDRKEHNLETQHIGGLGQPAHEPARRPSDSRPITFCMGHAAQPLKEHIPHTPRI